MCTALSLKTDEFYFGRNLDYEFSYGEAVIIAPREYQFKMQMTEDIKRHYAIIGMAHEADGYPLYYDAVNEEGLCIAGLSFEGNAVFSKTTTEGKTNIAQFELVAWLLGKCKNMDEVRTAVGNMNMTDTAFSEKYPPAQLHWMIADRNECTVLEITAQGTALYDNEIGVLTNNPPFSEQSFSLCNYPWLSAKNPQNGVFAEKCYSRGMGAMGLPGDWSSQSRFVRTAFLRAVSRSGAGEEESVSRFFHILGATTQVYGCCEVKEGQYERTIYSSCCNAGRGIYYYNTYKNSRISAVRMKRENLESDKLMIYPIKDSEQIFFVN